MSYLHCKIQYGIAHVLGVFESEVNAASNVSFRTGNIILPVTLPSEPWVYTGTQSEGSVDGTIEQDFKSPKVSEILRKTEQLLKDGVIHSSREFSADAKMVELLSNIDIAVDPFIEDVDGSYFEVPNLGDLTMLKAQVKDRRILILDATGASGGEGDLISLVTVSANTKVSMDAITDLRT